VINSITGKFSGRKGTVMYLMQNGLEWSIEATERTIQAAAGADGSVRIYTHLHHREDQMSLYGFSDTAERDIFLELNKVSGIGPKQAMRMLSGIGTEELIQALDKGDTDRLSLLPGIGKKTAAKIVLALRGKLKLETGEGEEERFPDLIEALSEMGFDRKKTRKAVEELLKKPEYEKLTGSELEKILFKDAIVYLSGGV